MIKTNILNARTQLDIAVDLTSALITIEDSTGYQSRCVLDHLEVKALIAALSVVVTR